MQNNISLDKLKKGEKAVIIAYVNDELPAKFYELGFTPGSQVEIKHKAPLHGPICVNILKDNTLIAIRKSEASLILTDKV